MAWSGCFGVDVVSLFDLVLNLCLAAANAFLSVCVDFRGPRPFRVFSWF